MRDFTARAKSPLALREARVSVHEDQAFAQTMRARHVRRLQKISSCHPAGTVKNVIKASTPATMEKNNRRIGDLHTVIATKHCSM